MPGKSEITTTTGGNPVAYNQNSLNQHGPGLPACRRLQAHHEQPRNTVPRPGGMNYSLPPSIPVEYVSGILFYAIAAANSGWTNPA
ncbi:MAG TPA: hypothetical protein VME24_02645 [Alphaproteobacteria bacterium]|nr:hypothetical protein [Alphaproteobacteria bacterium]